MTPAARAQAAIELLDAIIAASRDGGAAADTLIARYFKDRRYAGSKDRRAVRELVYRAIRRCGEPPASGRAALLGVAADDPEVATLFDGSPRGPTAISPGDEAALASVAPAWLHERLVAQVGEEGLSALLARAPLDLRVNSLKADRDAVLGELDGGIATPLSPWGVRLPEGTAVEALPGYLAGRFEIQDEGSQLCAAAAEATPGITAIDLCAGAGGKTLALAAAMADRGRLIACDVDRGRLARLAPRAARAGVTIVETRLLDPGREMERLHDVEADVVVIDAPCSGTGTWRRNPEARWRLTPARLARLVETQARLIALGQALVRPGGALLYIVCSLLPEEGRDQVAARGWAAEAPFAAGRADGRGRLLAPASDGTDGFFVARLRAPW